MESLESIWQDFRKKVIASDAPDIQISEMRMAFFSGAWSVLTSDLSDETIVRFDKECRAFKESVKRGSNKPG